MTPAYELAAADPTAVLVVSNFFAGTTPLTDFDMSRLLSTIPTQEAAYAAAGSVDPQLAGYESLGRAFAAKYPGPTLVDYTDDWFIVNTYGNAFGHDATPAQKQHFLDQESYFKSLYAGLGISDSDATIQARGVVIGQILAWAVREEGSRLNLAVDNATTSYLKGNFEYGKSVYDYAPDPIAPVVIDKADVVAQSFGTIDALHKNGGGGLLFGDGTTQAVGLQTVVDPTSGWTIASGTSPRQSVEGNFRPDKVSFDGVTLTVDHRLPSGAQDDANGSQADNAARGANSWSFTFGNSKTTLAELVDAGNKMVIGIDQDGTAGVSRLVLTSFKANDGTIDFKDSTGLIQITDSGGNANTVANSEQQNFFLAGGVAALTNGAQFSNSFEVFDANGVKIVGVIENWTLGASGYSPFDQLS